MLCQMKEQAQRSSSSSRAGDIEKNKVRGDLGITYDVDVLRLIDAFRGIGLYVGSRRDHAVRRSARPPTPSTKRLTALGMPVYTHYPIAGYPGNVPLIVSRRGLRQATSTSRPPARSLSSPRPAPARGKMATCLSLSSTMSTSAA